MKSRYYLSMYRMYYDSAYQPQGVVEVVQDCSIFSLIWMNCMRTILNCPFRL